MYRLRREARRFVIHNGLPILIEPLVHHSFKTIFSDVHGCSDRSRRPDIFPPINVLVDCLSQCYWRALLFHLCLEEASTNCASSGNAQISCRLCDALPFRSKLYVPVPRLELPRIGHLDLALFLPLTDLLLAAPITVNRIL